MPGPDGPCYSIVSSARARNVGGIVRLSAVLWGVLTGSLRVRGFQRFTSQKNVFRPMGWGKLAISFWCDGLVRERLERRRTASVAADVAAAMASG